MFIGVSRASIGRNVLGSLYHMLGFPEPSSKKMQDKLYGRKIYFVGAHDESAVRDIQGSSLVFAYVDEATCIPMPFWKMLESRLRVKGARLLATCNPDGPRHWLKKDYIDRAHELDIAYWNFNLSDNPSLDPEYVARIKKTYTGMWYKRYILGEWAVAQGLIYDGYSNLNLYEKPRNNPLYRIVGIDYGTSNATAAVLISIYPHDWPQLSVEQEYYYDSVKEGRCKTDAELARDIKEWIGYKSVSAVYVDPSAASMKLELRNHDLPVLDANNDVLNGIKITSKFVSGKNLVFHKSCETLIDCIQSYCWDAKAAERGEDAPLKKKEHILDALRYACYTAFPTGEFNHPDENLSIDQVRKQVYGEQWNPLGMDMTGYM